MKKTILLSALFLSGFVFQTATAQVTGDFRINIGTQPGWGPVGYDRVEYYYMPDIDVFYNVPRQQYVYQQRGRWRFSASLPLQYSSYDIYSGYKVVINDPNPYRNAEMYRTRYAGYKGNHSQEVIRNSRDSRYFGNKNHPEYNNWRNNNGNRGNGNRGNGNRGNGNGNGRYN